MLVVGNGDYNFALSLRRGARRLLTLRESAKTRGEFGGAEVLNTAIHSKYVLAPIKVGKFLVAPRQFTKDIGSAPWHPVTVRRGDRSVITTHGGRR